ncbi:MAG: long-chain-fatty-acid--CoA ligase [Bacillota bacterium]
MYSQRPWLKMYPEGVRPNLDYPEILVHDFLEETAKKYPNRNAFILAGRKLTYTQFRDQVYRMATALSKMGVKQGDRVGLMLPNSFQMAISIYATLKIGAIGVSINPLYTERELEHQINDSGLETIVFLDLMGNKVMNVAEKTPIKRLVATGIQDYLPFPLAVLYKFKVKQMGQWVELPKDRGIMRFNDLIRNNPPNPPRVDIKPDDIALLQYTGGTTGFSKGAMLTHRNLVANVTQLLEIVKDIAEEGKEVFISMLPYFHAFGLTVCLNCSIRFGATQILIPRFDVKMILESISKYKATFFPGTPTMYIAMLQYPDLKKYDITSLKGCISGAAPLPLEVQKNFQEKSGSMLVEGYGLSECSPVTHCNPLGSTVDGSIGIPLPDVECKIVDKDTGENEVPVGEIGELCIKAPQVMKGYWNKPEENEKVFRDGWFYTGDIARMDENGKFYIVERKKDLIIAGGYNIYPREVEEVLYEHPKVMEAAVAGVPHEYRGETVKAFIVLKEGQTATKEEIVDFCKERLAAYKVPKIVEFRQELPKTLVGKVLKRVLVEEEKKQ